MRQCKGGVHILDVGGGTQGGSPDNPILEGSFSVAYAALDIFVVKGMPMYPIMKRASLSLMLARNPWRVAVKTQWEGEIAPFNPDEIFVSGDYAYVCDQNNKRFYTIDISNPLHRHSSILI